MEKKEYIDKKNKRFSLIYVPEDSTGKPRSLKLTVKKVLLLLAVYTSVIFFAGYLILSVTGLGDLLYSSNTGLSQSDRQIVSQLNTKLIFLTKELESLKSTNERLKYAIILGDSSLIDSLSPPDTSNSLENKAGGSLLNIVKYLFSGEKNKDIQQKSYYFKSPVAGFISRGFEPKIGHFGVDFVVKTGTPVYAAASGFVIFADYTIRDGYMIILSHPDNYITVYKHCSSILIHTRDIVQQGELIALSGNTGEITTGPHLHFEIWKNGYPIDPKLELIKLLKEGDKN